MENCEIAKMVLPPSEFINHFGLFVNKDEKICKIQNKLKECIVYKFNTWMNMLAPKKYYYYCSLGELYLKLNISGHYVLQVIGTNRNAAFGSFNELIIDKEIDNSIIIHIPNALSYEGIYYQIIEDKANPIEINGVSWCTDKLPERSNKLAVVTCTYRREKFINKTIETFKKFLLENKEFKKIIKLIVVDNGRTLDSNQSDEDVKIIYNINAGGAGGFTRGLIEVLENYIDFDRILFMDDDVEIIPESFARTLVLSNYLKTEFKDSFICGAMMNLYDKYNFVGSCSVNKGYWAGGYYGNLNISDYMNILKTNDIPTYIFSSDDVRVDSAWWYCCFSKKIVSDGGLPLPLFFRGDDTEWGWRRKGTHHITMNGISVWHAPFEWRVSKVAEYYYMVRNVFMLNAIYNPSFKDTFRKLLKNMYSYLLKTYDYTSLEIFMRALEDILKGSKVYKQDPEKQLQQVNAIAKKEKYFPCDDFDKLLQVKFHQTHTKKWRKYIFRVTKKGRYAIDLFFKKHGVALEWFPPVDDFVLVKEVQVYNLLTSKYVIRKFDRNKIAYFDSEINSLLDKIENNFEDLRKDYIRAHKEFTSLDFWKKYLKMTA